MKRKLPPDYYDEFDDDISLGSDREKNIPEDVHSTLAPPTGNEIQQMIVEKVLGRKYVYNEERKLEELYFIKWKGLSYLHASWERKADIEQVDPAGKQKLKKFLLTPQPPGIIGMPPPELAAGEEIPVLDDDDVEYFNPEMIEVQRIVACADPSCYHSRFQKLTDFKEDNAFDRSNNSDGKDTDESSNSISTIMYLVKWRGLPYDESSWERWEEIKSAYREVWRFWKLQRPLPESYSPISFPSIKDYKKLSTSPIFGVSKVFKEEELEMETENSNTTGGLTLRDYQLEGVNWLLWNWWQKRPSILADEMGLGKTIQTVCFLHQLRFMSTTNVAGPFLIIAPLSLVDQWQSEVQTWSPDMNCLLLHGNVNARNAILNYEFYFQEPYVSKTDASTLKKTNTCKFHILLTTFEVAVKEVKTLSRITWQVMVIDEAHKLKNPASKLFTTLSTIHAHHCVLLTGTPLQNKTEELWSLLNFADPKRFDDMDDFMRRFGSLKESSQVASLHEMLRPYLLRRIKEDVEKSLPPKEETIIEVALTSLQKKFYRAIYEKNTTYLFRGVKASNQPSLMNVMMELRKCCNHPYLVRGVEERILSEIPSEQEMNTQEQQQQQQQQQQQGIPGQVGYSSYQSLVHQKMIESSGKLVLLDKLLPRLFEQGHKVLIFSQMVRVLNLLEDFLKFRGYLYERLDGGSKSSDRKEAVDRFCKPSMNRFIMLLSTKAGGLGLNLTAADTVIIYDSDWNPQNDLQAQARAHRIGQTKAVMVYRLLTRKTYEMQMFHQASMKLGLDRAVLAHARSEQDEESQKRDGKLAFDAKEIDELLKRGAYDVFREDDTEQNEFVEADIDSILQRRSHKVVYDKNQTSNSTSNSLNSFSKASFVSADEKEDVDINDPDFWRKAVGLQEGTVSLLDDPESEEFIPLQRIRKQTKVYGSVQSLNEEQLDQILKPIKVSKEDKKQQKALQKEAARREKLEKEEQRRLKIAEENRIKHDPKNWGAHGRDRVLRSLHLFGFGRWERIKAETGKEMMESSDLEKFCRAFTLQCGICAGNINAVGSSSSGAMDTPSSNKNDSAFVKDAIAAAMEYLALEKAGEKRLEMPPSLTEDRFVVKLRAGQAKKSLNKLDLLNKLTNMIGTALEKVSQQREIPLLSDLDVMLAQVSLEEVVSQLPLGDVRPDWARTFSWWDDLCDRHLILGSFRHGFGRYDLIRDDETLIFKSILASLPSNTTTTNSTTAGSSNASVDGSSNSSAVGGAQGSPMKVERSELTTAEENQMLIDNSDAAAAERDGENDMEMDDTGGGKTTTNGGAWPDPRYLNRLVTWLITSEQATMSKAEVIVEKEKQKRERKSSSKLQQAANSNLSDSPSKRHHLVERVSVIKLDESHFSSDEVSLIQRVVENLDYESIAQAYKQQALRKCEEILAITDVIYQDENEQSNSSETISEDLVKRLEDDPISTSTSTMDLKNIAEDEARVTENIAVRLCATFIMYGAPVRETESESLQHPHQHHNYDWETVLRYSKVQKLSTKQVRGFYYLMWLPFCEAISQQSSKDFSNANDCYIVPNPLAPVNEHHLAARGLCQMFLLRQQILYAIHFVLNNAYTHLEEYLRSTPGRNVEGMPLWWCPWIHDLGLLLGIVRHGFLANEKIRLDPDLPFHPDYLEKFIRLTFIHNPEPATHCKIDFATVSQAEMFVQALMFQFPESRDLEIRVMRILDELTKHLPVDHCCKVQLTAMYRAIAMQNGVGNFNFAVEESKLRNDVRSRTIARPPSMSLRHFMTASKRRRKAYVMGYHPLCFQPQPSKPTHTTTNIHSNSQS